MNLGPGAAVQRSEQGTRLGLQALRGVTKVGMFPRGSLQGGYRGYIRWTPHPVIVTIGDNRDYIRVLLYSYYTTITGWGVLLLDIGDILLWGYRVQGL